MRLFVSVDLPESLVEPVRTLQSAFADADGLDLVDPANAHVTLAFLGDIDDGEYEDAVAALERGVEEADVAPFEASFEGLGVFPSMEYISVVWLGVEAGADRLTALHDALEREYAALGVEADDHEFTPHVTLGRLRHAGGKERVREVVREHAADVGRMRVEEVRLAESTLTHDGPEYETRERVPLR
ncbi:RNA 2',3'-cyclic phosphodiesterase [Halarchaeum sp. CBA1220]|uniref:RNA 2',3'-cyclic phosphodiesterase n=1 Tax=Halarchaeum sp. CBA1220 TaxID=1853682 RepID=UPI000F3A87A0|nr:RNA 2',3'-cyclic phosphodiesterase [Halarchaeum sp. CBA1220]QLC33361.1 RNA 2',3'-cyclic phosphodiesterase [Halarchaeum sp. CBA1220]